MKIGLLLTQFVFGIYASLFTFHSMVSMTVHTLSKRFGSTRVFEDLSFSFGSGVLGIAGSNGSGKSTLLKCLSGLLRPTSGTVTWQQAGEELSTAHFKSHLGYIAPYINLYHELTVRENLDLILQLRKASVPEDRIKSLWTKLEMEGLPGKPFGDLSTGQQQRAKLVCTLSYDPSILFLDEPGANLDEQGRTAIRNILDDFREADKTVLLASNNPDELELADEIFSVEE